MGGCGGACAGQRGRPRCGAVENPVRCELCGVLRQPRRVQRDQLRLALRKLALVA